MIATANTMTDTALELHITRVFDAPRDLVWAVWTDAASVSEWMGSRGFTARQVEDDFRPGGRWRICLRRDGPEDGCGDRGVMELWKRGEYREILPPRRLVYTFAWENRGPNPGYETLVTVTFEEFEGKTLMDFRQGMFESEAERDGHNGGWSSTFDRLAEFLGTHRTESV